MVKVNAQLADLAKNQATQTKYEAAVAKADGLLASKDYNNAITAYKEANRSGWKAVLNRLQKVEGRGRNKGKR